MLAAAFTLAFLGLLRMSSLFPHWRSSIHAYMQQETVSICQGIITPSTSRSKPTNMAMGISLEQLESFMQPWQVIWKNKVKLCLNEQHHSVFTSRKPLMRNSCLKHTHVAFSKMGYNPKDFNTHSFCIGVAMTAAHGGICTSLIKILGRWKSDVYRTLLWTCYQSCSLLTWHQTRKWTKH